METRLAEFKVRTVGLAARCEICHQDDLFNAETGECGRCQNVLLTVQTDLQFLPPAPETVLRESISAVGRGLATVAAAISLLFALPGLLAFLSFFNLAFLNLVQLLFNPTETTIKNFIFTALGAILPVAGFFLLFWYWKIALKPTLRRTRNRVWTLSTMFNGLLLMSAVLNLNSLKRLNETDDSLILYWFLFVTLMMLVSTVASIEEVFRGWSTNAD